MWASLGLWGRSKATGQKKKKKQQKVILPVSPHKETSRPHSCFQGFYYDYFQSSLTICNKFFSQELLIKIDVLQQAVVRQSLPRCLWIILQQPEEGKHKHTVGTPKQQSCKIGSQKKKKIPALLMICVYETGTWIKCRQQHLKYCFTVQ